MQNSDSETLLLGAAAVVLPLATVALKFLEVLSKPPPKLTRWQRVRAWLRERKEIFIVEWEVQKFAITGQ